MSVKRPRITEDIATEIDLARGSVPFEVFVRDALGLYLDVFHDAPERLHRHNPQRRRPASPSEVLINLVRSDLFQMDEKDFGVACEQAHDWLRGRLDEFAQDAEMED